MILCILVNYSIRNAKVFLKNCDSMMNSYLPCSNLVQALLNANAIFCTYRTPMCNHFFFNSSAFVPGISQNATQPKGKRNSRTDPTMKLVTDIKAQ